MGSKENVPPAIECQTDTPCNYRLTIWTISFLVSCVSQQLHRSVVCRIKRIKGVRLKFIEKAEIGIWHRFVSLKRSIRPCQTKSTIKNRVASWQYLNFILTKLINFDVCAMNVTAQSTTPSAAESFTDCVGNWRLGYGLRILVTFRQCCLVFKMKAQRNDLNEAGSFVKEVTHYEN